MRADPDAHLAITWLRPEVAQLDLAKARGGVAQLNPGDPVEGHAPRVVGDAHTGQARKVVRTLERVADEQELQHALEVRTADVPLQERVARGVPPTGGKDESLVDRSRLAGRVDDLGEHFVGIEIAYGVIVKVQKNAITAVLPKGTLKSA